MTVIIVGIIAGLVGLLVAAELALRALRSRLPLRDWWNWEAENKVRTMTRLSKHGGASVAVIGSSMIQAALDPELLWELVPSERPPFNAALNGANACTIELWTRHLVIPLLRPEVVVLGVDSLEMNDNTRTKIFDRLSTARPWLRMKDEAPLLRRLLYRFERISYLIRFRRLVSRTARERAAVGRRGSDVTPLGYTVLARKFHNRPYHATDEQRAVWNLALNEYATGGRQLAALNRLLDELLATGIRVIVVNMPTTKDWIDQHPRDGADFASYETAVAKLVQGRDVSFVDLSWEFPQDDYFGDPVHVNGRGQERFTRTVADLLVDATAPKANA